MVNQYLFVTLETIKNDQRFALQVPMGAPFGSCEEALAEFSQAIEDMKRAQAEKDADVSN